MFPAPEKLKTFHFITSTSGQETFIGIFAQNSVTWHCTMQMCNAYSMILVPLYDTLGCEAVQHILNTTKIRTVIVDSKRLAMLLEYLTPDCSLKTVVTL